MSIQRRDFLAKSAAGMVALGAAPPIFLSRTAQAAEAKRTGNALVVVEMAGGNDGLNTVIPYADAEYRKNRPGIGVPAAQVLKLNDHIGFHPRMKGMQQLYDDGALALIQGVGYPNPNRSHFRSMDIWQSAYPDSESVQDGWLGRALDVKADSLHGETPAVGLGSEKLPLALVSRRVPVPAIQSVDLYRIGLGEGPDKLRRRRSLDELAQLSSAGGAQLDYLRRTAQTAYASADRMERMKAEYKPAAPYPNSRLAQMLKTIAQMLAADLGTELFYVSIGGFDTHSQQPNVHATLLGELSDALRAFVLDLRGHKLADRVAVMTFSEFGRRVKENGSLGTDHGAGSQLFVVRPEGRKEGKAGVHGAHPSLSSLVEGDLAYHTDFRSVYATLLDRWVGVDSTKVLGAKFNHLSFV